MKRKKNSKKIGGNYEREFSRKLSSWLTGNETNLVCWRATHSGSVSTNSLKKNIKFKESGDFRCTDLRYAYFFDNFHIDSKSLGNINLFIYSKNKKSNNLYQEWATVVEQALEQNKIPLMPVQFRGARIQFMVLPSGIEFDYDSCINYDLCFGDSKNMKSYFKGCFSILPLDEFFKRNKADQFYNMNKRQEDLVPVIDAVNI